ncbi:putative trans-sialidase, Group V [Trypanosoma cruzi]|nr:putative trans-sialidase, Group V [Trypanosoma cruzi]
MLSRVAAVKAPRTHNRLRVTGSSGRRREGRESEPQRPNISRRVFTSAVLLLLVVMMCFCGSGGAAKAEEDQWSDPKFEWKDVTDDKEVVESLGVPGLLKVGSDVFAVAEAQCKEAQDTVFTGIASQLLTETEDNKQEEVLKDAKDTQILEKGGSPSRKVDVSRPTAVVKGNDIYMLVGKYGGEGAAACQGASDAAPWGLLLLRGNVSDGESVKRILWKNTYGLPCIFTVEHHESLTRLIGGGGSGLTLEDDTLLFPVEATKENGKTVSLVLYLQGTESWTLSKGMSADGCSDPSVVEREKGKLMMMTACDDGRRRVYESGDKGESWTEALGTLSRVWGKKHKGNVKGVRSGFITATIDGVDSDKRNVMLVTLPVYSEKDEKENEEKGVLHLWLTDNTHIVDIGPVSGDDDVTASSLLYKSSTSGNNNHQEELIALYEKKKVGGETPSPGMVSLRLTEQLERVKKVLATWKKVDERVSKLCPFESALEDTPADNACSAVKITAGLVGFLSGDLSGSTWRDDYLGVNATVMMEEGAEKTENGVTFKGRGAWAEWPVGKQGENQLYHFANYNFTLVTTVSIDGVPKEGDTVPLMGAKMDDDNNNPVLLGLSYNKEKKWILKCSGQTTEKLGSTWEPQTTYQVAIVLQNGTQGSVYVDGQRVGDAQYELENKKDKKISHFYIGGDGGSAEGQGDVSVTVENVLLYNRPLTSEEIAGLSKNTITIPKPEGPKTLVVDTQSPAVIATDVQVAVSQSNSAGQRPLEEEPLTANIGAGGVSSAASVATTPASDASPTVATGSGDTMRGNGSPQTPEVSVSSGGHGEKVEVTNGQEEGIHSQVREVNATALSSSLGNVSQGNNTDAGTMRVSGLPLLLLLGLWGFAAL